MKVRRAPFPFLYFPSMKIEHAWNHAVIANYLLTVFRNEEDHLLLKAAADDTQRWNLRFALDYENIGDNNFGGTANYNKKERRFDFIEYSDRKNFGVQISIRSGCYCSSWEMRDFLYHNVPEAWHPEKKLSKWLLTH